MEGNYHKILQARSTVPAPPYRYFMDSLVDTVRSALRLVFCFVVRLLTCVCVFCREKISDCSEKAYESLPVEDARKLLMLDSAAQVAKYAEQRKWTVAANVITFSKGPDDSLDIPAHRLIDQTLKYAQELERIV